MKKFVQGICDLSQRPHLQPGVLVAVLPALLDAVRRGHVVQQLHLVRKITVRRVVLKAALTLEWLAIWKVQNVVVRA